MDKPSEQHDAAAIEEALPSSSVAVEELTLPSGEPVEVAVIESEPPKDELEIGYRYGQLEARMRELEEKHATAMMQLAAFEAATVAAVETEQAELDQQGAVLADVAEEVLPPDHDGANALDPGHKAKKPAPWEWFFGGTHRRGS